MATLKLFIFIYRQSYGRCVLRALYKPINRIKNDVCTFVSTLLVVSEDEGKFSFLYLLYIHNTFYLRKTIINYIHNVQYLIKLVQHTKSEKKKKKK